MLKQLESYSGRVVKKLPNNVGYMCKCRHSHIFKYSSFDDWCHLCADPMFQQSLIQSTNTSLRELNSPFTIFSVNKYGIATYICSENHIYQENIDTIPAECGICKKDNIIQVTNDSHMWAQSTNNFDPRDTFNPFQPLQSIQPITQPEYMEFLQDPDGPSEERIEEQTEEQILDELLIEEYSGSTQHELYTEEDTEPEPEIYDDEDQEAEPEEERKEEPPRRVRPPVILQQSNQPMNLFSLSRLPSLSKPPQQLKQKKYIINPNEDAHIEQAIASVSNMRLH